MPEFISDMHLAGQLLRRARRICVVGCSGGGKSTLSQRIARALDLNYVSIDRDVRWLPGWRERDRSEQRSRLAGFAAQDRWVMDGSGSSSFDIRLPRTDLVVWVRLNRWKCLLGVARRIARYRGTVRPDMADGCPEPLPNRDFLSYIWNFERKHAPLFERGFDLYGPQVPVVILKSHREIGKLLDLAGVPA